MKTALISGASGLVGSYLLKQLLDNDIYEEIKILVRKPLEIENSKLEQIVFDYENPNPEVVKADHIYCCLGTTMKKAGSKEAFKKVDYEYPLKIAKTAYDNGAEKFGLVSAMGANTRSIFFYNKVKGQVEEDLKDIPFEAINIFRPSMLLGPRNETRLGEEIGKKIMKPLSFLLPSNYKAIHASQVAKNMVYYMNQERNGVSIIPSGDMIRNRVDVSLIII